MCVVSQPAVVISLLFLCASDSEVDTGDPAFADVAAANLCMPMKKIIRKEIRKVNALHEAKLVKPVQGFTRLRSPRREEVIFWEVHSMPILDCACTGALTLEAWCRRTLTPPP